MCNVDILLILVGSCIKVTRADCSQCCFEFAVPDGGVKPVLPEVHSVDSSSSFHHASSHGAVSRNWSCVTE